MELLFKICELIFLSVLSIFGTWCVNIAGKDFLIRIKRHDDDFVICLLASIIVFSLILGYITYITGIGKLIYSKFI